jgi:hypothetical protein
MKYRRNRFVETIGAGTKGKPSIHPSPLDLRGKKINTIISNIIIKNLNCLKDAMLLP